MSQQLWYIMKDGHKKGPYSKEHLEQQAASGAIAPADLLWTNGMPGWSRADQIQGLPLSAPGAGASASAGGNRDKGLRIALIGLITGIVLVSGYLSYELFFTDERKDATISTEEALSDTELFLTDEREDATISTEEALSDTDSVDNVSSLFETADNSNNTQLPATLGIDSISGSWEYYDNGEIEGIIQIKDGTLIDASPAYEEYIRIEYRLTEDDGVIYFEVREYGEQEWDGWIHTVVIVSNNEIIMSDQYSSKTMHRLDDRQFDAMISTYEEVESF